MRLNYEYSCSVDPAEAALKGIIYAAEGTSDGESVVYAWFTRGMHHIYMMQEKTGCTDKGIELNGALGDEALWLITFSVMSRPGEVEVFCHAYGAGDQRLTPPPKDLDKIVAGMAHASRIIDMSEESRLKDSLDLNGQYGEFPEDIDYCIRI